jgi:hypothetical protein
MGLTLHYTLRAPAGIAPAEIPALVRAMRSVALGFHRAGRVDAVLPIARAAEESLWCTEWLQVRLPDATRGIAVEPHAGRLFLVDLGEGAEPLRLGLCAYPDRVTDSATGRFRAVRSTGWRLGAFCKTHYAGLHGWEHFLRCHTAAVDLLAALRPLGVRVTLNDEGGYWPGRRTDVLRRNLEHLDGLVAALAGALKDAADETAGPRVQAPIFAHPNFERLEAAGAAAAGPQLAKAVRRLTDPKA